MKLQFEVIEPDQGSSFRILDNPRLNNFYYWHFHPEYELTFIEAPAGTRKVGAHSGTYEERDLVLIGSDIPHLNFDYGLKEPYEKIVLQIKPDFFTQTILSIPELQSLNRLFSQANQVWCFQGETKIIAGERLKKLPKLSQFEQYIEILEILHFLSESNEFIFLHESPFTAFYSSREQTRIKQIYDFIAREFHRPIRIAEVAALARQSDAAFCRYFKKVSKLTFTEFLNQYRINHAKKLLISDKNVTETCYACGFESLSYFNRVFRQITGENPSEYRKRTS